MLDIFNLLIELFAQIINFLDSFYLIGSLSILRIFIIVLIFNIGLNFLIRNKKRGD